MQTLLVMEKAKNPGIFPPVMRTFHESDEFLRSTNKTGVIKYRGLNWRIMSDTLISVEIYGDLVTQLPPPLLFARFQAYLYDFMPNGEF